MFKNLLSQAFNTIAKRAVESAEANFGPGKGIAKKRYAINFILARTPLPAFARELLDDFLVEVLDLAIERAVDKLNS